MFYIKHFVIKVIWLELANYSSKNTYTKSEVIVSKQYLLFRYEWLSFKEYSSLVKSERVNTCAILTF